MGWGRRGEGGGGERRGGAENVGQSKGKPGEKQEKKTCEKKGDRAMHARPVTLSVSCANKRSTLIPSTCTKKGARVVNRLTCAKKWKV